MLNNQKLTEMNVIEICHQIKNIEDVLSTTKQFSLKFNGHIKLIAHLINQLDDSDDNLQIYEEKINEKTFHTHNKMIYQTNHNGKEKLHFENDSIYKEDIKKPKLFFTPKSSNFKKNNKNKKLNFSNNNFHKRNHTDVGILNGFNREFSHNKIQNLSKSAQIKKNDLRKYSQRQKKAVLSANLSVKNKKVKFKKRKNKDCQE